MAEREPHDLFKDPEMESRLRSARPQPDIDFVSRLEGELFETARAPHRRGLPRWRPAFAAGLAVAALALLTLVFDLAGLGPFSSDNGGSVQAGNNCHTVGIAKRERQPVTVNGQLTFRYRTVHRHVTHCH